MNIMNTEDTEEQNTWMVSIDMGKKNFCIYIEETNINVLKGLPKTSKEERFNNDGTPTEKMRDLLLEVYKNGKTILHMNKDLTENTDKKKYLDTEIYYNMIDYLDSHKNYFDKCSIIVIEQQMNRNSMAIKLGQHCYSYFAVKYGRSKQIIVFPAYYKTILLGAEKVLSVRKNGMPKWKTIDQRSRKKWAIEKAKDILNQRNEIEVLDKVKTAKKKDDLSDTICQLTAFKIKTYLFEE